MNSKYVIPLCAMIVMAVFTAYAAVFYVMKGWVEWEAVMFVTGYTAGPACIIISFFHEH